jgi:uncharacterized protein YbgA (DUF1722 family)
MPLQTRMMQIQILNRQPTNSKFKNVKCHVRGFIFDSIKEAERYIELYSMQQAGKISNLELQVPFDIVINGQKVCTYKADFVYLQKGVKVVEDVKSSMTKKLPVYRLKNKLMQACFGVVIKEI